MEGGSQYDRKGRNKKKKVSYEEKRGAEWKKRD